MSKKLTLKQAQGLVEQGFMNKESLKTMVENGELSVFRFRSQNNKPEVVKQVHEDLISTIEPRAYELLEVGYRPSIIWNRIDNHYNEEETFTE